MAAPSDSQTPAIIHWHEGVACCDEQWEQAYQDFETPAEERRKFHSRYRKLGVDRWDRDLEVVEIFCGRGNGLRALDELGFRHLEGVDLSPDLLAQYEGRHQVYVGDCRELKFADQSKDVIIVQGGLHHLPSIPDDLALVVDQVHRILKPGGHFVAVEPWLTPFLRLAHLACDRRLLRRCWHKLDALARMTEREITTYEQWLAAPDRILQLLDNSFSRRQCHIGWGKLMYDGVRDQDSCSG